MISADVDELSSIIDAATFLNERLDEPSYLGAVGPERPGLVEQRLGRLRRVLGLPDTEALRRHLERECDWSRVLVILGGGSSRSASGDAPSWSVVLAEVMRQAKSPIPPNAAWVGDHPFGESLWAFAAVARRRLEAQLSQDEAGLLTPDAWVDIERACLVQTVEILGDCLLAAFSLVRQAGNEWLGQLLGAPLGVKRAQAFDRFVQDNRADGLLGVFRQYPVAARLAATKLEDFVAAMREFVYRYHGDLPKLRHLWKEWRHGPESRIIRLELGLSDPHEGGRSVIVAHSGPSSAIVYKPRSLRPEHAWNDALRWIDETVRRPGVLDRGDYGWMEFVVAEQCSHQEQVERFFRRLGALLCAAYLFGGKDFHRDNLIAAGEHPVLIDLETLGQPDPPRLGTNGPFESPALHLRQALFASSVMRAEFLPCWRAREGGAPSDESALSSPTEHTELVCEWRAINTDFMNKVRVVRPMPGRNLPSLGGAVVRPEDYAPSIETGFTKAWQRLEACRDEVSIDAGPAAAFRRLPFRFIFRGTSIYSAVLRQAANVENLRSGIDFSIELQALCRVIAADPNARLWKSLVAAEIVALQRGDVPRFGGNSGSCNLIAGASTILPDYFTTTGESSLQLRLQQLNSGRLKWNLGILRNVLYAEKARSRRGSSVRSHLKRARSATTTFGRAESLNSAIALGNRILECAATLPDGSLCWTGLVYRAEAAGLRTEVLNDSLYEGNVGVSLFLAALYRAGGGERFRNAAFRALSPLKDLIACLPTKDREAFLDQVGLGVGSGLGGFVYGLTRAGRFLEDPTLIESATVLSSWLTDHRIAAQLDWDVLGGLSGAILGLLALAKEARRRDILALASRCGSRIMQLSSSGLVKETSQRASFAHGVLGAAATLARLRQRLDNPVFHEAKATLMAHLSSDEESFCATGSRLGWCNGTAGAGLASLMALGNIADEAALSKELLALRAADTHDDASLDQICCGTFGMVDLLISAGQRLNQSEVMPHAWAMVETIISRAQAENGFHLHPEVPSSYHGPGLFQGIAGIGYGLLRLREPALFPSILMLE